MLPYDVICQLAHTLLDGTVIDITKGLRDIQNITEKNLSTKRLKIVNEQRSEYLYKFYITFDSIYCVL